MSDKYLLTEKYRPRKIKDCILPDNLKKVFTEVVETGDLPNMLLSGTAGLGKTTVAKAICDELNLDWMFINGSEEGNIDTLRSKIRQFASTVSLRGEKKVVILDEADYLNAQSFQPALRGFMEEFSGNCRFILTCNFKNKIIAPLHSRCAVYEFNTNKKVLAELNVEFMSRLMWILDNEGIKYEEKAVAGLIMRFAPDWRRIINECQRYSSTGAIDMGVLNSMSNDSINELIEHLKSKNFKKMRSWVSNNIDTDSSAVFRKVYDNMYANVKPESIPNVVLILARYQYQDAFVTDHEINTVACLTELMVETEWK